MPAIPAKCAGTRMLPPTSVPTPSGIPAAIAAALPPRRPAGRPRGSTGSPSGEDGFLLLVEGGSARVGAPPDHLYARRSAATTPASSVATMARRRGGGSEACPSAQSSDSLMLTGEPWSGPRTSPRRRSSSARRAAAIASWRSTTVKARRGPRRRRRCGRGARWSAPRRRPARGEEAGELVGWLLAEGVHDGARGRPGRAGSVQMRARGGPPGAAKGGDTAAGFEEGRRVEDRELPVSRPGEGLGARGTRFDAFNLLVGVSGVGNEDHGGLRFVAEVAHGGVHRATINPHAVNDAEWSIRFTHEGSTYEWSASAEPVPDGADPDSDANGSNDSFVFPPETLTRDEQRELDRASGQSFVFQGTALPKLRRTESALNLLAPEAKRPRPARGSRATHLQ